ncbi:MAG TPA: PQQ-binding-like beta-propeller repeat protein [Pirellulales bacterium]|nr:PQQ-binding-like beta-propeller repeat protein [Pirellulales bacterium]
MKGRPAPALAFMLSLCAPSALATDWTQFRGPHGLGISEEKNLPLHWSSNENIAWKAPLSGPGSSSPTVVHGRVYVTCYTGYGLEPNAGEQANLRRHLFCFDRKSGSVLWSKEFEPKLPEHAYQGEGSYQGYAPSTPISDGERLYVFFGKSGVYCFDLNGAEKWHVSVGDGINGWGSGPSPVLFGKLLLVNASVESGSLVALDKLNGNEVWRAGGIGAAWDTPLLLDGKQGTEVVVSVHKRLLSFNPLDGQPLWNAEGIDHYICPSVVAHGDVIFAIGGGHTSLAVRSGGSGDVTASQTVWRQNKGSNVSSPVYHDGYLYWASDGGGFVCCQDAATGATVFQERLEPGPGKIWSSALLADGKLYFVSQHAGTYVVAARPKFEQLAHNVFADDDSRANATPAVSDGQLFLRTDRNLYCIGKK